MKEYKRLTIKNEENGLWGIDGKLVNQNQKGLDVFEEAFYIAVTRLAEIEDKIENGTLIELQDKEENLIGVTKMKDKENQIEKMAKEIEHAKQGIWASVITREDDEDYLWHSRRIAEHLTGVGYQKVDKDKQVVLTKEEYEKLKQLPQKIIKSKDDIKNKFKTELKKLSNLMFNEIDGAFWDGVNEGTDKARKETAREIIEMFSDKNYITEKDLIKAIAKRYGVKIKND